MTTQWVLSVCLSSHVLTCLGLFLYQSVCDGRTHVDKCEPDDHL